jgi:hypothetical protein
MGLVMKLVTDSVSAERVDAIASFGFTERQARFLVTVMVYAGAFLERQYCTFAEIAHGQKTHDFVRKLIDRGYVTVITPGALHRGRLFHLQYKPLYEAIGEPNNRNRRPATMGRMIERLMVLDAVLADRRYTWLGTEQDKVAYFKSAFEQGVIGAEPCLPHLVFGTGAEKVVRYFPDKMPVGLERDYGRRHVFLYLVTSDVPAAFRMFLFRHADLLGTVQQWTIRVIVPRRFKKAIALYRYAVREEFATPLKPSSVDELESVFRCRAGTAGATQPAADFDLIAAKRKFAAARFRARYRMWRVDPSMALWGVRSSALRDKLTRGEGRIEFMELPHQYLRLTSLVGVA